MQAVGLSKSVTDFAAVVCAATHRDAATVVTAKTLAKLMVLPANEPAAGADQGRRDFPMM
ncbi:hypothetical protein [Pseudorhodobacter ferrugineus]|uniref:hypothetical protein n=1 Tax=Pseudorhodobacter ferrugineus TaxID=77008 RepID=UPI0012DC6B16|nr:hypothetical protein [Pseudorhodobacter ferrugineus]